MIHGVSMPGGVEGMRVVQARRDEIQLSLDAAIESLKREDPGSTATAIVLEVGEAPFLVLNVRQGWKVELLPLDDQVLLQVSRKQQ